LVTTFKGAWGIGAPLVLAHYNKDDLYLFGAHRLMTWKSPDNMFVPETHTKRQATQHSCLPSLLGDGVKGIEIVYVEEKNIFCTGPTRPGKAEQKSLIQARQAQQTNQGRSPLIRAL
jgi:hypothetical protein